MIEYFQTSDRPDAVLTLPDALDVTTGYTFTIRVGNPDQAAIIEKTAGITGGAGTVTVEWDAGELDIARGLYALQLTATSGTGGAARDRVYETVIRIKPVVQPATP